MVKVWAEGDRRWVQSGSKGRALRTEFFRSVRLVVILRSPPWSEQLGSHLRMDRKEPGFGASYSLRWADF